MAAQQGFLYEENATKYLQKLDLSDGVTAGASHTRPDLMLTKSGKEAGCELKITNTAGGSLVIHYYNNEPHWRFGSTDGDPEKEFLKSVATTSRALNILENEWERPWLQKDATPEWKRLMLKYSLRSRYERDLESCPNKYIDIPNDSMQRYYNHKNTHYINIGTHGFFLLGNVDPLGINANCRKRGIEQVPQFSSSVKMRARIRTQSKGISSAEEREDKTNIIGAQGYQFTFTLEFSMTKQSPYNIAPIRGSGDVKINESNVRLDCLL